MSSRLNTMGEAAYLAHCRAVGVDAREWDDLTCKEREGWRRAAIAVLDLRDDEDEDARPLASNPTEGSNE